MRAGAILVAAGIFLSRVAGLIRDRVFSYYFGLSPAADAFKAALRIPNFLQNLFGEGVLSASFIPVYAGLLGQQEEEEAGRMAGAIFSILAVVSSALVLVGVMATPLLIDVIAPGFHGEKRELAIALVRILFPGAGLLVLSAWCLGILNSHRRFFLSYSVPVLWNAAIIAGLVAYGSRRSQHDLAIIVAWASVAGSLLQFLAQLPAVRSLVPHLRLAFDTERNSVRAVIRNFVPVFVSRGVVQISAYIDALLASFLPDGAVAALSNAQTIYLLPVSLFGMAVAASELPEMSRDTSALSVRLRDGLRRIAFFVIPSAVAFVALGDQIAGAIYRTGKFTADDAIYVWAILAGSGIGLLASTQGRLYSSAFYALKDTRTPLRFAIIRVTLTMVLGYLAALPLPALLGVAPKWGVAGLTASAGLAGWVEFFLLRRALSVKVDLERVNSGGLWACAVAAAGVAWTVKSNFPIDQPIFSAASTLGPFGLVYLGLGRAFRLR